MEETHFTYKRRINEEIKFRTKIPAHFWGLCFICEIVIRGDSNGPFCSFHRKLCCVNDVLFQFGELYLIMTESEMIKKTTIKEINYMLKSKKCETFREYVFKSNAKQLYSHKGHIQLPLMFFDDELISRDTFFDAIMSNKFIRGEMQDFSSKTILMVLCSHFSGGSQFSSITKLINMTSLDGVFYRNSREINIIDFLNDPVNIVKKRKYNKFIIREVSKTFASPIFLSIRKLVPDIRNLVINLLFQILFTK